MTTATSRGASSGATERWEQDGLYSEPGVSLVEARELLGPGVNEYLLETYEEALAGR